MNKQIKLFTFLPIFIVFLSISSHVNAFQFDTILEKTIGVSSGEELKVEAQGGDIDLETWSRDEVYVHITGNSEVEDEIEFEVVEKDYGVYIKAEKEGSSWGSWGGISYKIAVKVPESFNADVATSGGDIKLNGLNGKADLKTSGGDVVAENTTGNFEMATSGGDVKVKAHDGSLDLGTSGGDVRVVESRGSVDAGTSGGDVRIETADGSVNAGTSGGDIYVMYGGDNKGISVGTTGGDITLMLDSDVKADLTLKTTGGDIDVDLDNVTASKVTSSKFSGNLNGGGPEIECGTTGGDITIKGS